MSASTEIRVWTAYSQHATAARIGNNRFQLETHVSDGVPSVFTIPCKATTHKLIQSRIEIGGQQQEIHVRFYDRSKHVGNILTLERLLSCQHLKQHTSKREYIAALICRTAACLLGRHVSGGSNEHASHCSA